MILLIVLLSSLWGLLLAHDSLLNQSKDYIGLGPERKTYSNYKLIDFILFMVWKLLNCPLCISYWIFSISYLIIYGTGWGFIYGIIVYYLTSLLQRWIQD